MAEFDGRGYGEFKLAVGEAVADQLVPLQERFADLSKNKLAKEAAMAAAGITPVKRPKGRPKGSKDSKPRKKAKRGKSVSEGLEK